jgi:hypothetical protein
MTNALQRVSNAKPPIVRENTDGFLRKLAALVAQIYTTYSQIAQNDRQEIHRLEATFKVHSFESADLTRSRGNLALGAACLSLFLFAISMGFANSNDRKFVQLASEKAPDVIRLFDSHRDGSIKRQESLAQIEMTKIQDKNSRSQTDGNIKEQFASVLQAEIQRHRSAAASSI